MNGSLVLAAAINYLNRVPLKTKVPDKRVETESNHKEIHVIHQFDTVIVGSGGAGLYAALEASQQSKNAVL